MGLIPYILSAILLFCATPAHAWTLVQSTNATAGAVGSINKAYTSTPTLHNLLVVHIDMDGTTVSTVAGGGQTWNLAKHCQSSAVGGGDDHIYIYYAYDVLAAATTVTVTFAGTSTSYADLMIHEFSGGMSASDPLDQTACMEQNNPGTGTDAVVVGPVTTVQDGELIYSSGFAVGGSDINVGTGFTVAEAPFNVEKSEYKTQTTSSAATTATWTFTGGGTDDAFMALATFKVPIGDVEGCYIMENGTDFYLMENNSDKYALEGGDGGLCGGGAGPSVFPVNKRLKLEHMLMES